jgi:hypothetical protein
MWLQFVIQKLTCATLTAACGWRAQFPRLFVRLVKLLRSSSGWSVLALLNRLLRFPATAQAVPVDDSARLLWLAKNEHPLWLFYT